MSRSRSKKKKGRVTANQPTTTPDKQGKKKRHTHRVTAVKEKKKSPPWLVPLMVFAALLLFVGLALYASSAMPTK